MTDYPPLKIRLLKAQGFTVQQDTDGFWRVYRKGASFSRRSSETTDEAWEHAARMVYSWTDEDSETGGYLASPGDLSDIWDELLAGGKCGIAFDSSTYTVTMGDVSHTSKSIAQAALLTLCEWYEKAGS